jgi:predicted RNA-binding Zn-ribbon protein involved in translation (DUF1610 family)
MSDFITFACPSCGGQLEVDKDSGRVVCGYCGNEHVIRRTETLDRTASELAIDRIQKEIQALKNSRYALISQPETEAYKNDLTLQSLSKEIETRDVEIAKLASESKVDSGNTKGVVVIFLFVSLFFSAVYFLNKSTGVSSNMSFSMVLGLNALMLLNIFVTIIKHAKAVKVSKGKLHRVEELKNSNEKTSQEIKKIKQNKVAELNASNQQKIADIDKKITAKQDEINSHYKIVSNFP